MRVCQYCNNEYSSNSHFMTCTIYLNIKENITLEYLTNEYLVLGKSAIEISKQFNLNSAKPIIKLLKVFNIKSRNISESINDRIKQRKKQTNIERYGESHNFNKKHPSRIKWEKNMLKEHGIKNIFQRDDIKEIIKTKTKETKIEKGIQIPDNLISDYIKYKKSVYRITRINWAKFKNKINPMNLQRGRNAYHLDHIYSIKHGFLNNINPHIIAHRNNLRMIEENYNISKSQKCDITLNKLFKITGYGI